MPYEFVSVASCFNNILGPNGENSTDSAKQIELLDAILRVSMKINSGDLRRSKFKEVNSNDAKYTPERAISLLNTIYSNVFSTGTVIFTLPYNIIDELRTCYSDTSWSETPLSSTLIDDNVSIYFEKIREEKSRLRQKLGNEYSPAHGDLVCKTLPSQLTYNNMFPSKKRAYFVVNNATTPPSISIKIVDKMKLGDRFCQMPARVYLLERISNTHGSVKHRSPFVIGEFIVIHADSNFTKAVHTWSSTTTIYCKRHTQFDGSCCITASQGSVYYHTLHAQFRTEYTLHAYTKRILVSAYLMSWLRTSNQNVFAISEKFLIEKASFNKLSIILNEYTKTIDKYRSVLTLDCSENDQSKPDKKNSMTHQDLIGSLPSHIIELSKLYDFLVYPYCSLVANSPIPYVPSNTESSKLQSILEDRSNPCLNIQLSSSFGTNYMVDVSSVFCCGPSNEILTEELKNLCEEQCNIVLDDVSQCNVLEKKDMRLEEDREVAIEMTSNIVQAFPTYKTLHTYLRNKLALLKNSQTLVTTCNERPVTDPSTILSETVEPHIKRNQSHILYSNKGYIFKKADKDQERYCTSKDTGDTAIYNSVYKELFGDPLRVCGFNDKYDYIINYHYKRSFDGYFHLNYRQSDNCILPINYALEVLKKYNCIKFFNILNVLQRRYSQLAIHSLEIYTLLKEFHIYKIPIPLFIQMLSCVTSALRGYPFGGLFTSLLCHMWLAYDVADELNCIFTAVWTLFRYSAAETHTPVPLNEIFSYTCGNVIIERYFRYSISWYQRPQTILEFLLMKVQPTKTNKKICDALRDLFRFTALINRIRAWYN